MLSDEEFVNCVWNKLKIISILKIRMNFSKEEFIEKIVT